MEDRLINVCVDAIALINLLGRPDLANTLQKRIDKIMGYKA
jgi:hypothetical protein